MISAFKYVVGEAQHIEADPLAYNPFANIRKTTKAGVLRFVYNFSRLSSSELCPSARRIECRTDSSIAVCLVVPGIFHVKSLFRPKKLSATLLEKKVNSKSVWYRNFDWNYCHQANVLLMETDLA